MSERELEIAREGSSRHQVLIERSREELEQQHHLTLKAHENKIKELVRFLRSSNDFHFSNEMMYFL